MSAEPSNVPPSRFSAGRKGLLAAVALAVIVLFAVLAMPRGRQPEPPSPVPRSAQPAASASTAPSVPDAPARAIAARRKPDRQILPVSNAFTTLEDYRRRQASMPRSPAPLVPAPAGRTPETELGRVRFGIRDFRAALGSNPTGNNREITRALLGDNPRGARFLDPATATLDATGQLLDSWGHPYFFHALSGSVMEIRSAGPDGKIFTADDLVQ